MVAFQAYLQSHVVLFILLDSFLLRIFSEFSVFYVPCWTENTKTSPHRVHYPGTSQPGGDSISLSTFENVGDSLGFSIDLGDIIGISGGDAKCSGKICTKKNCLAPTRGVSTDRQMLEYE